MKTIKFFFGIIALLIITAISANAQIIVTQGSTHNFKVTNDHSTGSWLYTYLWSTNLTGNNFSTPTATATDIKFITAGATIISVIETNPNGEGCPTTNTFNITVLGTPTLGFTLTASNSCANKSADPLGLTFTGVEVGYYPLVVTYSVGTDPINRVITFNTLETVLELPLPITDRADGATIAGPSYPVVVTLISAVANGGDVTIGINKHTNTVYDIPDANGIIMVN